MDNLYLLEQSCQYQIGDGSYWGPWLLFGGIVLVTLLAAFWEWRDYKKKGEDGDDDIAGNIRLILWTLGLGGAITGFAIIRDIIGSENVIYGTTCDGFIAMWQWLSWALLALAVICLAGSAVWMSRVSGLVWFWRHRSKRKK